MKTLLILRHAKSNWDNANLDDHERPLNDRGLQDAPRMGHLLKEQNLVPDLIMSSTAERALKTAELVALAAGYEQIIQTNRRFYLARPATYLELLQGVPETADCVMIVGHNPGMEELVRLLTGHPQHMPTAALAHVQLPITHWGQLAPTTQGQLLNFWQPKSL